MDKRDITKKAVKSVVGVSITFVVKRVIDTNVEATKKSEKTMRWIGSYMIGALVSDRVKEYTDKPIDAVFDWWYGVGPVSIEPIEE